MIKDDVILLIELLTKCHFNLLITGGVGAGKTQMLMDTILPQINNKALLIQRYPEIENNNDNITVIHAKDFKNTDDFNTIIYDELAIKSGDINKICQAKKEGKTVIITTNHASSLNSYSVFVKLKELLSEELPNTSKKVIKSKIDNLFDFHIKLSRQGCFFYIDSINEIYNGNINEIIKFENNEYKTINLPSIIACEKIKNELEKTKFDIFDKIIDKFN